MGSEIFLPVFYMVGLTVVVFLLSTTLRLKEIYLNGTVAGEEHRHPPFNEGSTLLKTVQRIYPTYLSSQSFSTSSAFLFMLREKSMRML